MFCEYLIVKISNALSHGGTNQMSLREVTTQSVISLSGFARRRRWRKMVLIIVHCTARPYSEKLYRIAMALSFGWREGEEYNADSLQQGKLLFPSPKVEV